MLTNLILTEKRGTYKLKRMLEIISSFKYVKLFIFFHPRGNWITIMELSQLPQTYNQQFLLGKFSFRFVTRFMLTHQREKFNVKEEIFFRLQQNLLFLLFRDIYCVKIKFLEGLEMMTQEHKVSTKFIKKS